MAAPLIPCGVIWLTLVRDEKAAHKGGFITFKGYTPMPDKTQGRTIVYIDGYNLYYGRLRGTPFKWLDLIEFCTAVLARRDQNESLECVKFFTAPALATFATHGDASVEAQSAHHRALQTRHDQRFQVVLGKHSYDKSGSLLPVYLPETQFDRTNRIRVWHLEEKKTDVNLALAMYRDANKKMCDRMVLVSNDSDAEPALSAIREDFPHIQLGVIMPIRPPAKAGALRRQSGSLSGHAHWVIDCITDEQLAQAQRPAIVQTKKKPIRKPAHW
jgi:uncharacterized LabA/DUF88 family protein